MIKINKLIGFTTKKWNYSDVVATWEKYNQGWTYSQTANLLNRTPGSVSNALSIMRRLINTDDPEEIARINKIYASNKLMLPAIMKYKAELDAPKLGLTPIELSDHMPSGTNLETAFKLLQETITDYIVSEVKNKVKVTEDDYKRQLAEKDEQLKKYESIMDEA
ncbi:MAG: hypothetical protein ACREQ5_26905, partial [Candidatus Dormibacteria bacterium]